jgi:hypothetical protein
LLTVMGYFSFFPRLSGFPIFVSSVGLELSAKACGIIAEMGGLVGRGRVVSCAHFRP